MLGLAKLKLSLPRGKGTASLPTCPRPSGGGSLPACRGWGRTHTCPWAAVSVGGSWLWPWRESKQRHFLHGGASEGGMLHDRHLDVNKVEDFWHLTGRDKKSCSVCVFPILLQSRDTSVQTMRNASSPKSFSRCRPKGHPGGLQ